jgi:hypothetical protein
MEVFSICKGWLEEMISELDLVGLRELRYTVREVR